MPGVTGLLEDNTYGSTLFCNTAGTGLTSSLQTLADGLGTASCLSLSTVAAQILTAQGANTSADGLILANNTAATSGNQQYSGRLRLTGQGFTSASKTLDWIIENQPTSGTASNLVVNCQVNGGGYGGYFPANCRIVLGSVSGAGGTIGSGNGGIIFGRADVGDVVAIGHQSGYVLTIVTTGRIGWVNSGNPLGAPDTYFAKDAIGQISVNGSAKYLVLGLDSGSNSAITCPAAASGAGNTLTIYGSAAGSGNTNGGNINERPGAKAGSGADGLWQVLAGTGAAVALSVDSATGNVTQKNGAILTIGNSAVTGLSAGVLAALTNASIVITDQSGQAYRIPCII